MRLTALLKMPIPRSAGLSAAKSSANAKTTATQARHQARSKTRSKTDAIENDASDSYEDDKGTSTRKRKRRRTEAAASGTAKHGLAAGELFTDNPDQVNTLPCSLPARLHQVSYHYPLLLKGADGAQGRLSLLSWFDSKSAARAMPWRKEWIDPKTISDPAECRSQLERRAYEVWISEIMLQQTRVAVVIDYWNRWMARWPTIHDLAKADREDVLAMWQGLGYYSRATRIHEAAKLVVDDGGMRGLLPNTVAELQDKIPGVGRYTAGAISATVFGHAEPMVDGNVLRVLSRQLGIHGNVKTDKRVVDKLWAAADALAKAIAVDGPGEAGSVEMSDRPGRWGQGLMELGSTVCTPRPRCSDCPITATCRVYTEARAWAKGGATAPPADIEELCGLCEPLDEVVEEDGEGEDAIIADDAPPERRGASRQTKLAAFAFTRHSKGPDPSAGESNKTLEDIANHAKNFPIKIPKKAIREEETLVCAIRRRSDGCYLMDRRPDKGLLAGLWELPSYLLESDKHRGDVRERRRSAQSFVTERLRGSPGIRYDGEIGTIPWVFSHLKLAMHVHVFTLDDGAGGGDVPPSLRRGIGEADGSFKWSDNVDGESMGTGMRKCWALVKRAQDPADE